MWNVLHRTIIRLTRGFCHTNPFWDNLYDEMATNLNKLGVDTPSRDEKKIDGRDLLDLILLKPDVLDYNRTPDEMTIFDLGFALSATHVAQVGAEIMIKYNLISACNVYEIVDITQYNLFDLYHGFLRECRGTVINLETEELVVSPFRKFANMNEWKETKEEILLEKMKTAKVIEYSNKLDGSLIIARAINGEIRVFSSGNISEAIGIQISWAKEYLDEKLITFLKKHSDYTCMFELIDHRDNHVVPINRPVGLYLTGMRDIRDGSQLNYCDVIRLANEANIFATHLFNKTFAEIMEMVKTESHKELEGFVLNIDGYFVKIKCEDYLAFQRVRNNFNHNDLIPLFLDGTIDDAFAYLSDIDREYYEGLLNEVLTLRQKILRYVDDSIAAAPKNSRKEFAIWVQENCIKQLQGFILAKSAGQEIEPLIKRQFPIKYIEFMEYSQCFAE